MSVDMPHSGDCDEGATVGNQWNLGQPDHAFHRMSDKAAKRQAAYVRSPKPARYLTALE